jgi:predicted O-methyltransferase YrrM
MKYFDSVYSEEIEKYAKKHSSENSDYLEELERITYLNTTAPRMISGWEQGRFLSMISKMLKPKNILEIGTFTGYSALCMAEGLADGGQIVSLDINEEWSEIAKEYIAKSPFEKSIKLVISDAAEFLNKDNNSYDLIFIDADKESYPLYFDLCIDKIAVGGFLLADNVLWSGKVLEDNPDKKTQIIQSFNEKVLADERVENFLLPLRDGINIIRKIK